MALLTIDQAMRVLKCRRGEVNKLLDRGILPCEAKGTRRFIAPDALIAQAVRDAQVRIDAELSKGSSKRANPDHG
ncbi:DNA-binding protein [bacterium]|nr:MAG: DNA-binding protein [bacterium]